MSGGDNDAWIRGEPGFHEWRVELMRLYRRARRRKLATLLVALVAAGAVVLYRWRKNEAYAASVTFRVSEGPEALSSAAPPPTVELREYVSSIALSNSKVADVMEKYSIALPRLKADPITAVQLFREDLKVEVSRNYFIEEWQTNKSARLTMTYTTGDAARARAVISDLAQLVVDDEARRRKVTIDAAAITAEAQVLEAQRDVDLLTSKLTDIELRLATASPAQIATLRVEAANARGRLPAARDRVKSAQIMRGELQLALIAEANQLAVRFDRVDESLEAITKTPSPIYLVLLGLFIFVLALPMAVLAVGAHDGRVYDLDDVGRLGLEPVGHVPPFRGDGIGSMADRRGRL